MTQSSKKNNKGVPTTLPGSSAGTNNEAAPTLQEWWNVHRRERDKELEDFWDKHLMQIESERAGKAWNTQPHEPLGMALPEITRLDELAEDFATCKADSAK